MFHIHPGTSDCVLELMIATQLKGLGSRRKQRMQATPVATSCQLRHGKMATRSYGYPRPENHHMPYNIAALPNLQKALARKGGRRTANELLPYSLSLMSYS